MRCYGDITSVKIAVRPSVWTSAQCLVALLYQCGLGVAPDVHEAERRLRKAADQNNPLAWNNLGSLYAACIPELKHRWGDARRCYEKAKELGFDCAEPYPPPFVK
jgi:TPR repeat protein